MSGREARVSAAGAPPRPGPGVAAPVRAAVVAAPRIVGLGLVTGWGEGPAALRAGTGTAPAALVAVPTPALTGDRFRRSTRECLVGAEVVKAALAEAGPGGRGVAEERIGIVYASASGYAAANRAFLEDESATTLHFPYTAPSAVPGEVTIEFGIRGPCVTLMGGGTSTLQAIWCAARWLADGVADRVLVLAVETMHEVRDLFARARRLYRAPLVEGAACLALDPGNGGTVSWASAVARRPGTEGAVCATIGAVLGDREPHLVASSAGGALSRIEARCLAGRGLGPDRIAALAVGETLACGPLYALAGARAAGAASPWLLTAGWRDEYGALAWQA
jgi:hypothetical protein